jgi:hypothetical protein
MTLNVPKLQTLAFEWFGAMETTALELPEAQDTILKLQLAEMYIRNNPGTAPAQPSVILNPTNMYPGGAMPGGGMPGGKGGKGGG